MSDGTLAELLIAKQLHYPGLFNEPVNVSPLCAALRSSTTLTSLTLQDLGIWTQLATGNAILRALTGHASLQKLDLFQHDGDDGGNAEPEQRALAQSVAITALVAADAPALPAASQLGRHLVWRRRRPAPYLPGAVAEHALAYVDLCHLCGGRGNLRRPDI